LALAAHQCAGPSTRQHTEFVYSATVVSLKVLECINFRHLIMQPHVTTSDSSLEPEPGPDPGSATDSTIEDSKPTSQSENTPSEPGVAATAVELLCAFNNKNTAVSASSLPAAARLSGSAAVHSTSSMPLSKLNVHPNSDTTTTTTTTTTIAPGATASTTLSSQRVSHGVTIAPVTYQPQLLQHSLPRQSMPNHIQQSQTPPDPTTATTAATTTTAAAATQLMHRLPHTHHMYSSLHAHPIHGFQNAGSVGYYPVSQTTQFVAAGPGPGPSAVPNPAQPPHQPSSTPLAMYNPHHTAIMANLSMARGVAAVAAITADPAHPLLQAAHTVRAAQPRSFQHYTQNIQNPAAFMQSLARGHVMTYGVPHSAGLGVAATHASTTTAATTQPPQPPQPPLATEAAGTLSSHGSGSSRTSFRITGAACKGCRAAKQRCSQGRPCSRCVRRNLLCEVAPPVDIERRLKRRAAKLKRDGKVHKTKKRKVRSKSAGKTSSNAKRKTKTMAQRKSKTKNNI
jgi:Fungal Zn(2)-Cys(6) binuclear cluster domain